MSSQRRKAREARLVEQEAELAAVARRRRAMLGRRGRPRRRPSLSLPRRRRRYGDLPTRTWAVLLSGWAAGQLLAWQFLPEIPERIVFAVLTGACLLVATRPSVRGSR